MTRYYVRPEPQVAYGIRYTGPIASGTKRLDLEDPHESFHANFSGYIAHNVGGTVQDAVDFYLHGHQVTYADGSVGPEPLPEDMDRHHDDGHPISGDYTALYWHWRHTLRWPSLREVWASIGLGPDGQPPRPVQTSIFDLLETP